MIFVILVIGVMIVIIDVTGSNLTQNIISCLYVREDHDRDEGSLLNVGPDGGSSVISEHEETAPPVIEDQVLEQTEKLFRPEEIITPPQPYFKTEHDEISDEDVMDILKKIYGDA